MDNSNSVEKVDLQVYETPQELAVAAALLIRDSIREKADTVLGLATGSTPVLV